MTLRLKSYFQAEANATGTDWDDLFDSVPLLKSETADGASAVAGYIDTTTLWANPGAKLWSFRNNGVEKASVDLGGKFTGSSFVGNGSAVTALNGSAVASGLVPVTYGGTGIDAHLAANGKLLIGNGTGYTLATLTAGANVTVTNGAGTITIASTGGSTPAGSTGDYQYNNAGSLAAATWKELGSSVVGLGGATSSFPALKRSTTFVQVRLADDSAYAPLAASQLLLQADVFLTRTGGGLLRLGDVDAASPVNQGVGVQGSRAGVDTNTNGADLTFTAGIGTGNAGGAHMYFVLPVPDAASGTTAHTTKTALDLTYASAAISVGISSNLGTLTAASITSLNFYARSTWNDATNTFTAFQIDITNTASAAASLLAEIRFSGTTAWSVRVDGLMYTLKTKYGTVAIGAGNALLGANCPAVTVAAPYAWFTFLSSDGSTVYVPAWK